MKTGLQSSHVYSEDGGILKMKGGNHTYEQLLKKMVMLGIATTMTFGGVNNTCYAMEKADTGVKVEDTTDSIGPVYNKSGKVGTMYSR